MLDDDKNQEQLTIKSIAIFIRNLDIGGAEKQSILLARLLGRYYKTYLILFYGNGPLLREAEKNDLNLVILKGNIVIKSYRLFQFLKSNKIHALFNFLPLNNMLGAIIGKIARVARVYGGIRGARIKESKLKMLLMRFACNQLCTGFISNSYCARDSYSKFGFNPDKISVIHNCIIPLKQVPDRPTNANTIEILTVGRFIEDKDYYTAVKSIKYLKDHYRGLEQKLRYRIIGYGNLEPDLKQMIKAEQVDDIIQIVDGRREIEQFFTSSDIYLSTSAFEGMPNAIMEAMNYGLPIVATDAGDTKYLVDHGINGYICPVGDHKSLAQNIVMLLNNPTIRNRMAQNSLHQINQNYSTEKFIDQYKALIEA